MGRKCKCSGKLELTERVLSVFQGAVISLTIVLVVLTIVAVVQRYQITKLKQQIKNNQEMTIQGG